MNRCIKDRLPVFSFVRVQAKVFSPLLFLLMCAAAQADTVYYVDSAWTGSQSGTAAAPWQSLNSSAWSVINSSLQSGGVTVYFSARKASSVADGLYDSNGDGSQDVIDVTSRTSTSSNVLTLDGSSYYNSNESSASWSPNSGSTMCLVQGVESQNASHTKYSNIRVHGFRIVKNTAGKFVTICGDNWTVENCDMSHTSAATDGPGLLLVPTSDSAHEGSSYYAPPCANIVIRGNVVHDTFGEALYIGGGGVNPGEAGSGYPSHNHILIESNKVFRAGVYGGQGDGIDIKGGLDFLTVRGNEIYNLSGASGNYVRAIVMQGQYQQAAGQVRIVEKNNIHDCSGLDDGAIVAANSWGVPQGLTIRNNLIYNVVANTGTPDGIKIYASQDAVGIYNNTIYNCAGYAIEAQNGSSAILKNNFIASNNSGSSQIYNSSSITSDYNAFSVPWGLGSEGSHSISLTSTDIGNSLVNASGGDFRLKSGAPVIGKATAVSGFSDDIVGTSRGSVWDISAYQYATVSGIGTPVMSVTPLSQDFGSVALNATADKTFTVQNTGTGTLSGTATVATPFSIVSGGTYSLAGGQSQVVTVRFSPTVSGTNTQTVTFTGGGGATAKVTGVASASVSAPVVSAIAQTGSDVDPNLAGLQIYAGSVVQYSGSASDPNGLPLTWQWIFVMNGGTETVFQSGSGPVTSISYNYPASTAGSTCVWKLRVSNGSATSESTLTVGIEAAPAAGNGLTFQASAGTISAPFVVASDGSISQASDTIGISGNGRATYAFTITNAGSYAIQGSVNASTAGANSFYVNIDADPQDPTMIWDIPVTAGFEQRIVSWRGNGTSDANQFVPKVFNLTVGTHTLIILGREANTSLASLAVLQLPPPPQNLHIVAGQ